MQLKWKKILLQQVNIGKISFFRMSSILKIFAHLYMSVYEMTVICVKLYWRRRKFIRISYIYILICKYHYFLYYYSDYFLYYYYDWLPGICSKNRISKEHCQYTDNTVARSSVVCFCFFHSLLCKERQERQHWTQDYLTSHLAPRCCILGVPLKPICS